MPQRQDLDDTRVDMNGVVEVVLDVTKQNSSKTAYPAMWHGFTCMRKPFDQIECGL